MRQSSFRPFRPRFAPATVAGRFRGAILPAGLFVAGCLAAAAPAGGQSPAPPPPLVTPDDLAVELFAAEPLLSSPSDIDVDSRGRVWVCEVTNYRGKKETRPAGDRILVLEDTDGDGKADKQTVFHQGRDVDSALGICVIGEGAGRKVIVSVAPDVFVFHDDDGDLKADRKESLFTKTGQPQHDHSVHAFVVGPDGRWYFNFGNTGKAVHDRDGNPVKDRFGNVVNDSGKPFRQGMVFRCRPDGTDFEVLGHNFRNNYEVAVDSFGTLWQSDNDDDGNRGVRINYVMEHGNFGYTDELTGAGWQSPRTNLESEIPLRHWHQNDPGVVPNLLLTGGGSPCGICVYEGTLLPERFRGALVHCDAGPNVVRAYHVKPQGAGYTATIEPMVDGQADKWFRPSDVCVAPDGSLIVADWYDPGVGGHAMGDTEKGRIYRVAPKGSKWSVPAVDLSTPAGAVAALASPNLCTRAVALERLAKEPEAAAAALEKSLGKPNDDRHAARMAWALGMLPGRAAGTIRSLVAANEPAMRIIGLRMAKLTKEDVIGAVEKLAADPSPAVRRECAIALRGQAGERADRAWAELAARHTAGDRWELEALGLGADSPTGGPDGSLWDGRLRAWLAKSSGPGTAVGREIVWRSRGTGSAALIAALVADPSVPTAEALALLRGLDFQDRGRAVEAVRAACRLDSLRGNPEEKLRVILPELVLRLEPGDAADPKLAKLVDEAAAFVAGTQPFVEIARRFRLAGRTGELVKLAGGESAAEQLRSAAVAAAIELGGEDAVRRAAAAGDADAGRLLSALGVGGGGKGGEILTGFLADANASSDLKTQAVRGLARSQAGGRRLVELAKEGRLTGVLPQVAAVAIASGPWGDVRQAAADVLPMPKAKGGEKMPPVADLVKRRGDPQKGKELFAGAGTCAKCHVVNNEGKAVGPNLSGVGAKLSREALYESVLAPSAGISHSYETWTAVCSDGRSVTGMLVSRTPQEAVIRGADAVDVTIPAGQIEELVKQPVSLMPADLAATLTADELVHVVTWMETLRATQ
jgi:putative membrane-bound dehydrogenase-like protein